MCISKLLRIKENNPRSAHNKTSSNAAAVPWGGVWLLQLLHPAALRWCLWFAHPWPERKAAFNTELHCLWAEGNNCKTGVSKAALSWKALIFQHTTLPVTISRQGHVIYISMVVNCTNNISRQEENIPLSPKYKCPLYPCQLAWAVKVTCVLGPPQHKVPTPTSRDFPSEISGAQAWAAPSGPAQTAARRTSRGKRTQNQESSIAPYRPSQLHDAHKQIKRTVHSKQA